MKALQGLDRGAAAAVRQFWLTRDRQAVRQETAGRKDQGARGAVTGGAQMDGFINLFAEIIRTAGMPDAAIFRHTRLELPGFYRPTKEWDLLVVRDEQLVCVIEAKSQVGPSFGNNFNNRTEEAIGSAVDLWGAYKAGAFNRTLKPWLGYLFLLEDCPRSQAPVKVKEPHFQVFPEFRDASYARRYELLLRKLVRENLYTAAAFLTARRQGAAKGRFTCPAEDLTLTALARSLAAHVMAHAR